MSPSAEFFTSASSFFFLSDDLCCSASLISPLSTPPWMAAPMATTSSGFTPLCGSLPKKFCTTCWTFGIRVMPPTRMTRSIPLALMPPSLSAMRQGSMVFCTRSFTSSSSWLRVIVSVRCLGPVASAAMNGRFTSVSVAEESSCLARSDASFSRRRGRLVDDAQHVQSGDAAGVLGSLALAVVEIVGDGDHRPRHLLAGIVLGVLLHLRKDHLGDLRGAVPLPAQLHPGFAVVCGD